MSKNIKNLSIFAIGIFFIIAVAEIFLHRKYHFIPDHLENNSYLAKRELIDKKEKADILFIGSSGFARGIDCTLRLKMGCLNLSVDGGDSVSYLFTFDQFIRSGHQLPKVLVVEIAELTFDGEFDANVPIKTFIDDHWLSKALTNSTGISNESKQAFRNRVDHLLFPFALNHFSRRKRFSEWPDLIIPPRKGKIETSKTSQSIYYPDSEKLRYFRLLVNKAKEHHIRVIALFGPFSENGVINPPVLKSTRTFQFLRKMAKDGDIKLISDLQNWGMDETYFSDKLLHFKQDKIPWFTQKLIDIVTLEEARHVLL